MRQPQKTHTHTKRSLLLSTKNAVKPFNEINNNVTLIEFQQLLLQKIKIKYSLFKRILHIFFGWFSSFTLFHFVF